MKRKILAAIGVSALLICIAVMTVKKDSFKEIKTNQAKPATVNMSAEDQYDLAISEGADLIFWYDDHTYDLFFRNAAISYYEKKGIAVKLVYMDVMDYVGDIYDCTMNDNHFPDVYLLSGEELEKAYLYGVAKENKSSEAFLGSVAVNAIKASTCGGELLGYPLSYDVCLLAYNKAYFEEPPESLQALIDYSKENDPDENVEYLLEWDVHDPFYNFLFVSESVKVTKSEVGVMSTSYDEAILETSLNFLQESLESFAIPMDTVSEQSVLEDIINGKTLCAIVDSSSLKMLENSNYEIVEFPKLNEEIGSCSVALTDLIIVNDFTLKEEMADDFAKYLCMEKSDDLWEQAGTYPVKIHKDTTKWGQIVFDAYENAILAPNSHDEGGFWVDLNEMITKYFE